MLYASADVLAVLVVGERACAFTDGSEAECLIVAAAEVTLQLVEVVLFAVGKQFDERQFITEVVEHDNIFI